MNPWAAFVLGLLIGWLIEWVIDWVYWRRRQPAAPLETNTHNRVERLEREIASLNMENKRLEDLLAMRDAQLAERSGVVTQRSVEIPAVPATAAVHDDLIRLPGVDERINDCLIRAGITTYTGLGSLRPARLREILGADSPGTETEMVKEARLLSGSLKQVDDLVEINGVGPVIANILYDAGVFSFADVGELTPADLREIIGERIERLANEEKILAHARELAGRV